jgi:protein SCO1/2
MMSLKTLYTCLLIALTATTFTSCTEDRKLPIYGHKQVVNGTDTVYQTIPEFKLLNQDSIFITNQNFAGKIYIADFFFTSCTSICPVMHRHMKDIFDQFKDNPDLMFLSHTIDFKYDKPSTLKKYAQKLGVDGPKWQFAYGSKEEVYKLAEQNYLVAVNEDGAAQGGYIHQGWLVLIDKEKRIRGAYDGTRKEAVAQLIKDIPVLLAEYKK